MPQEHIWIPALTLGHVLAACMAPPAGKKAQILGDPPLEGNPGWVYGWWCNSCSTPAARAGLAL